MTNNHINVYVMHTRECRIMSYEFYPTQLIAK